MLIVGKILVGVVGLEHLGFLIMEMFLWTTPSVMKTFGTTPTFAAESKTMAGNQGLYNGFLAAGLLWSLLQPDVVFAHQIQLFFLICVIVAAIYGAATVKRSILLVQGLPALLALIVVLAS